ncbi:uncharacterized protein LOC105384760 [Plutella xylostella]|uniref:uncharacterized protein LOC105384760 n=1 Tax=Plutella xylostella TaxID=51655 RepID=UPI002033199E|nr:uncharacterized protein LOC105384760 [Plutella xylostella]
MRRARSVTGPLRRAHPASGATWNVQVVRGKMSSTCLWHACRALSAGLLLMLLGAAMATIGYYADTLSVAEEIRGNATISVKDEARGFHLNNLSYAGPIVMGFGGFIVVAACVMTFEARDSAAKVTPARPTSLPRPAPRRCAPARLDQLGVYRLPLALPLPHALPLATLHKHRQPHAHSECGMCRARHGARARCGSAPDLRLAGLRAPLPAAALRRPLRRYALSVDEPPHSAVSASAAESECGSQSSLAMDLHAGAAGGAGAVTLRVRDNTRRRPLARQRRLHDDASPQQHAAASITTINKTEENSAKIPEEDQSEEKQVTRLVVEHEALRAHSAPLPTPPASPSFLVTSPPCELVTSPPSELVTSPPTELVTSPPTELVTSPSEALPSPPTELVATPLSEEVMPVTVQESEPVTIEVDSEPEPRPDTCIQVEDDPPSPALAESPPPSPDVHAQTGQ